MAKKFVQLMAIFASVLYLCDALPSAVPEGYIFPERSSLKRAKREDPTAPPDTQRNCAVSPPYYPPTTTETGDRLADLRVEMANIDAAAYIIPSEDPHDSEYIAKCHERRSWICGMTGSAGLAIVTTGEAAIWTDGRYFLQAEQQLDCNWELMKSGQSGTPSQSEWLIDVLPAGTAGDPTKVAFDPTLLSLSSHDSYADAFKAAEADGKYIVMYPYEDNNLVDVVWDDQPECTNEPLMVLEKKWTGQDWWDKITEVRTEMESASTQMMVLHALDDTAWLFNMRGADIPYNPVFFAYTIIKKDTTILYVKNQKELVEDEDEINTHLLQNSQDTDCTGSSTNKCLEIRDYNNFLVDLNMEAADEAVTKVWVSNSASYGIYDNVNTTKQYSAAVPIRVMKAVKNENEINGMKEGNIQDAIAKIEFLHWIEDAVKSGMEVTELSADAKLVSFRQDQPDFVMPSFGSISAFGANGAVIHYKQQPDFVMPSFGSISAFGANGAIIHYTSTNETNTRITDDSMYLLDSGGQYKCGTTTDTTRTMHFGTPEEKHMQAYTRVLLGAIDLSLCTFPEGTYGRDIDVHARQHLWNHGWNYRHGTGHGLGAMLNVHEGPHRISIGYREGQAPLEYGMFSSDEPGYYEDNDFGVRLETVFMVVEADTPNNFGGDTYFTFDEVAFVPFDPKLIKYELFEAPQLKWLNEYHQKVRDIVGPRLQEKNKDAYDWMIRQTEPVEDPLTTGAASLMMNVAFLSVVTFFSLLINMKLM